MKQETAKRLANMMVELAIVCTLLLFPVALIMMERFGSRIFTVYLILWVPIAAVGFMNDQWERTLKRKDELESAFQILMVESLTAAEEVAMLGASNQRLARPSHGARRRHVMLFLSYATHMGMTEKKLLGLIQKLKVDIRVMRDVLDEMNRTGNWPGAKQKWADALVAAARNPRYEKWTPEQAAAFEASLVAAGLPNEDQTDTD